MTAWTDYFFSRSRSRVREKKTYQLLLPVTLSLTDLSCCRRKVPSPGFVTFSTPLLEHAEDPGYNGRLSF